MIRSPLLPAVLAWAALWAGPAAAQGSFMQYEKARTYFAEGQYDECLLVLRRIDPDDEEVGREGALLRIRALTTIGRHADAEAAVAAMLEGDPGDVDALLHRIVLTRIQGRVDEAAAAIERLLEVEPENPGALCNRAILLDESGHRTEATALFLRTRDLYLMKGFDRATDLYWLGVAARIYGMRTMEESRTEALSLVTEHILPEVLDLDGAFYEAAHQMGSVWIDAFDAPYAKENYTEALEKNPRHPDLRAGMAATLLLNFGTRPQALEHLEKALEVNPRHSESLRLLAAVKLHDEEYEEVKALLDRALAVNPRDLDALSLLAGYHRLRSDTAAYEQVEEQVLALDPKRGDFYFVVAESILTKRQFHDAVAFLRKAIELDPTHWHAYIELGTNLMRIGVGGEQEARPFLEKAMKEFPYHVQSKNMLTLLETYDEYILKRHGDVHVRLHVSEDPLMRPYIEGFLDECIPYLEERYELTVDGPILFEIFHNHEDFGVRSIGLTGLGALGVCFGQVVTMDGPAAREGQFNWKSTAWHEFAHVVTLQRSKYRIPRWFTEGLSGLEEKRRNPAWLREQNLEIYSAWSAGRMRGIMELNAGFTRPRYGGEVIVCYYQGALVCEYIEEVHGWDKVLAMIDAYADRKTTVEAIRDVLGLDVAAFDAGFEKYVVDNYFGVMRVMPSFTSEDVEDLRDRIDVDDGDAEAYARLAAAYFQRGNHADAEIKAGQAISRDATDPLPYFVLGRILHAKERHAQARQLLEKAFALGGEDFHARIVLGTIYQNVERDFDKTVEQYEKARAAFPRYVDAGTPYLRLADLHLNRGDKARAMVELGAYLALNGEDHDRRLQMAKLLIEAGQPEKAAPLLREALETKIQLAPAHQMLAEVERGLGRHDLAIAELRALLEIEEPDQHFRIYADLAEVQLEKGDREEARRMAEEALERKPDDERAKKVLEALE